MGFLDNLRNSKNSDIHSDWKVLTEIDQIDEIIRSSNDKPVLIFKHSTTCGISAAAKNRLESGWDLSTDDLDTYYLDLLTYRPVSNAVAEKLAVIHQSPQIILVNKGEAVFTTSHHRVSASIVKEALGEV